MQRGSNFATAKICPVAPVERSASRSAVLSPAFKGGQAVRNSDSLRVGARSSVVVLGALIAGEHNVRCWPGTDIDGVERYAKLYALMR